MREPWLYFFIDFYTTAVFTRYWKSTEGIDMFLVHNLHIVIMKLSFTLNLIRVN